MLKQENVKTEPYPLLDNIKVEIDDVMMDKEVTSTYSISPKEVEIVEEETSEKILIEDVECEDIRYTFSEIITKCAEIIYFFWAWSLEQPAIIPALAPHFDNHPYAYVTLERVVILSIQYIVEKSMEI